MKRLQVVDALRGFAIVSIMLLHNIEHFDFYYTPKNLPSYITKTDHYIWETLFFLFGGKSFAIFALLFGVTFYIQSKKQDDENKPFRARFIWRMLLLLGFGIINSIFFQGDILAIYAVVALFMIPIYRINNMWLMIIACILLLQPLEILNLVKAINHPDMVLTNPESWTYFGKMGSYVTGDSFWELMKGNLTNGKKAVLLWSYENGRYFQILALFIIGFLISKKQLFSNTPKALIFWKRVMLTATISFILCYTFTTHLETIIASIAIRKSVLQICAPFSNLSFMFLMVSVFTILFQKPFFNNVLGKLAPTGRMSLSNYVFQSIIGSFIYYGYGLGLYQYTGATYSVAIGIVLAILFSYLSSLYIKKYKQGSLEKIWHRLTWMSLKKRKTTP